jgi:cellobiose phosphorylase
MNSWLTGTAAWNYCAIVEWILGVRRSLDWLEIDGNIVPAPADGHPEVKVDGILS